MVTMNKAVGTDIGKKGYVEVGVGYRIILYADGTFLVLEGGAAPAQSEVGRRAT